jgi:hypothetical protein
MEDRLVADEWADEWIRLTRPEQARRCRSMAEEARTLAKSASLTTKAAYLMLAQNWLELATEIEDSF